MGLVSKSDRDTMMFSCYAGMNSASSFDKQFVDLRGEMSAQ
jgi:hypothetical protein